MNDFPVQQRTANPLFIHTASIPESASSDMFNLTNATATAGAKTWVANLVSYSPMCITRPYPVNRVFWVNGSTITTTNVDAGIYTADGRRIYNTGSTAMVGASSVQYVTPSTPFILVPGRYYFAWTCDNTTSRGNAWSGTANAGRMFGMLEETTGGFGLPATMTPVAWARAWGASLVGITRTSSGF